MKSEWSFETVKTISALGSLRGTLHELSMPPGMVLEEDENFEEDDPGDTFDSSLSTRGSDPIHAHIVGASDEISHSTVIIKPPLKSEEAINDETPSGETNTLSLVCTFPTKYNQVHHPPTPDQCVLLVARHMQPDHPSMAMGRSSPTRISEVVSIQ